jgi:ATP-binding cassette subfamily B protein
MSDDTDFGVGNHTDVLPSWRIVLRLIRYRPWQWTLNLLAMFVLVGSFMLPGIFMREFFNLVEGDPSARFGLWAIVGLLLASEVAGVGGLFGLVLTNVPFFVHTLAMLRHNMLSRILRRPGAAALPDSPGEAISRFRGDTFELPLFALWLNDLIGLLVSSAAGLAIMFSIDARVTLFVVLPFLVVAFISNAATKRIEFYRRESRRAAGVVTGFVAEIYGAVQAIKVATAEESVLAHFREINESRKRVAIRDRIFTEVLHSIFWNSANIGTGIVLILAAQQMSAGTFSVGDFALFVFYLGFLSELTTFSGLLIARYKQIGISIQRMYRLMPDSPPDALVEPVEMKFDGVFPEPSNPPLPDSERLETLEVRDLSFTFPDSTNGIDHVSFALRRGTSTIVTGRVGSGKTTLLRVLLGLLPKERGTILWNGAPVEQPADFFVPPRAAYTAQIPRLFSDTLRANILLGREDDPDTLNESIRRSVLDSDLHTFESGYETVVGPKGVRLSGGQLQRTAAARMFVRDPELLVFDDLSSALDVDTERELWSRLFSREGFTCLAVSHRRTALTRAESIIVMKDGMVEAIGDLETLLRECEEMQHLWKGELA